MKSSEDNPVILLYGFYPMRLNDFLDSARGKIWLEEQQAMDYKLEIPAENGRYRVDDDKGSYLVDVVDGVVMHTGLVRSKGTVEPHWKLAADHSRFVKMEA